MQLTTRVEGDVTYLDLGGRIVAGDGANGARGSDFLELSGPAEQASLRDEIDSLLKAGNRKLVLNLAAVEFIDSAGLAEIVQAYSAASRAGANLTLTGMRILERLKLPWWRDGD
jgi:anti-sigma B factor antagonist